MYQENDGTLLQADFVVVNPFLSGLHRSQTPTTSPLPELTDVLLHKRQPSLKTQFFIGKL